ncbi:MAG: gliding motility-associated C-terminal domain-containing protein [Crocinitomicaceae bacterium]|nr:gliding motility-associated C-terminal domain-containing protein [Crocinitomicaceae bacterium]
MKLLLIFLFTVVALSAQSQVQCAVDVTINEGDTLEMCKNASVPITAVNGFVSYAWTGPSTGIGQTLIPISSGLYILSAADGVGCISFDTIVVIINNPPADVIISSAGDTLCQTGGSTTLSLSGSYLLYDWGGGNTGPTSTVTSGGTYTVTVADANFCVATFTYDLAVIEFAVDTTYGNSCTAGAILLIASGGTTYSWSTGETGDQIVVAPSVDTNITVTITAGSCVGSITTLVTPSPYFVYYQIQDTFVVAANESVLISGPEGFNSYSWFPGNQLIDTTGQVVHFNGTESQILTLNALHPDGCIMTWTTVVIIVDLIVPNGFSPNGDSFNDLFIIPELDTVAGNLVVWNRWGDIVFQANNYANNWNGTCQSARCIGQGEDLPEGTYFYQVDAKGVTKEGYVTLKRK